MKTIIKNLNNLYQDRLVKETKKEAFSIGLFYGLGIAALEYIILALWVF